MGNMELLREFIARSGISLTNIAKQLNITYVALNNKLKGKYAFTLDEALLIKKILGLTQTEWNAIFDEEV
jgi:plasmid maintenance system antidote protein VapI